MRSFARIDRIRQQLRRDVSDVLRRSVKGYDLSTVTVTEVEVSRDCKHATVYYTVMATGRTPSEIAEILDKVRPVVQAEAGQRLGIRAVPKLSFEFDDSVERGMRLGELFSRIETEREHGQTDSEED